MTLPKNILVPTDFSDGATAALDYAVELAAKLDARVHLVNVVGLELLGADYGISLTPDLMNTVYEANQKELDRIVATRKSKVPFGSVLLKTGEPRLMIEEAAKEVQADLVVMGTHGRRGFRRLIVGSVAESVARSVTCPILLVKVAS